jgi:hypothetical protein
MSQVRTVFLATVFSVAALLVVAFGVGALLAKDWTVETTRTLHADAKQVGALVRDLATWARWAAIDVDLGPQTVREVQGEAGSGTQRIVWTGPQGKAVLTATAVTDASIDYTIGPATEPESSASTGRVEWQAEGAGCRIRWIDRGRFEPMLKRWSGWFGALQERIKQIHASSLEMLEREFERTPPASK